MARMIFTLIALVTSAQLTWAAQPKKPNVLIICGDDHAAYVMGAYGNKLVRTPNLDRLAASGMRFDRAYCSSPVCTPSRQSFLTGRYPRTIGVTQLPTPLPEAEETLADLLKRAGYRTAAIGKMHFNSTLKHGFDVRLDIPDHRKWLDAKGKRPPPEGVDVLPAWKPFKDHARTWLNSKTLPFAHHDEMAGTYFADRAIQFLKDAKDEPFLLMVSFTEPHSPFHFPIEYRGRHQTAKFAVPKVGRDDDDQVPAIFRDLTDQEKQGIAAAYYTSVEFLDHNVGRVLETLEKLSLAEDTLIIYLGDHGYCLGHHGRFEKHSLYEVAVRSPFLMSHKGRIPAQKTSAALVGLIDMVPTILETFGQEIPKSVQGKSLAPLLAGKTSKVRDAFFVEYAENEEALVRTDDWAFFYGTGKRERKDGYHTGKPLSGRRLRLYDMKNDPEQMTNLAKEPRFGKVIDQLTHLLAGHLKATARQPELLPPLDDVHVFLESALQPRDVPGGKKK